MCYPYPGPRCSAYAIVKLNEAHMAANHLRNEKDEGRAHLIPDFENKYEQAKIDAIEAQRTYDATPAGIKYLETQLEPHPRYGSVILDRLTRAKQTRKNQLDALNLSKDLKHIPQTRHTTPTTDNLSAFERPRDLNTPLTAAETTAIFTASAAYVNTLTDDEIAALRHYTINTGHIEIAAYLHGFDPNGEPTRKWVTGLKQEELPATIHHIDTALAKAPKLQKPVYVYRGLSTRPAGIEDDRNTYTPDSKQLKAHIDATYKPGAIITNKGYSSTSYDPVTAAEFASESNIIYQIKTIAAVPIAALSTFTNDEKEALLPRGMQLKVTGVQHLPESRPGKGDEKYVIAMEEIQPTR